MIKKISCLVLVALLITACGTVKRVSKDIINVEIKKTENVIPEGYEFKKLENIKNFSVINLPAEGHGNIPISNDGGKDKNQPVFGKGFQLKQNNGPDEMPWINYERSQVLIMTDRFKGNLNEQYNQFMDAYSIVPKALKKYSSENVEDLTINGMAAKKLNINYYRKPEKKDRRKLTYGYIVQYSKTDAAFFIIMDIEAKETEIENHVKRIDQALRYMIETAELKK